MILTEYDENEFRDFLKEEAWNEGHKAGRETVSYTHLPNKNM